MAKRNFIQRIFGYFFGRRHLHVPSTMVFPPLDAEVIKQDLALAERGQQRGERGQPLGSSTNLDEVEAEVITLIEEARHSANHTFQDHLATYSERLGSLDLNAAASDMEIRGRGALSDFDKELSQGADDVYTARRNLVELEREMRQFREEHGLRRTAHFPRSQVFLFSIMVALILVEAIANGLFLGETHIFGLSGGVVVALVIAVINVTSGGIAGRMALTQLWHRRVVRKMAGMFGLGIYLTGIFFFNLGVAHYRDALSSGMWETATTEAYQSLLAGPLGVTDMHSWLLFFIGFSFSLIAMVHGLHLDDRYPGYGKLWRKVEQSREDYGEIKTSCLETLAEMKDGVVNFLISARDELADVSARYHAVVSGRERLVVAFQEHLRHLEHVANDLLTSYRGANTGARSGDEPAPNHFQQRWQMRLPKLPEYGNIDPGKIASSVARMNQVLGEQITRVHAAYDKAVRAFRRIEELSEEELASGSAKAIVEEA